MTESKSDLKYAFCATKDGFNWNGKYTFGSYLDHAWYFHFYHEYALSLQICNTVKEYEDVHRAYLIHRKIIRQNKGVPSCLPKCYRQSAMCLVVPMNACVPTAKEMQLEDYLDDWKHSCWQICYNQMKKISLCYKFILQIAYLNDDGNKMMWFHLFCNDKDIWSKIEAELRQVFAQVKTN
jgi:hypothetical protein